MTLSHMFVFSLVIEIILPKTIWACQKNPTMLFTPSFRKRTFWLQNREDFDFGISG